MDATNPPRITLTEAASILRVSRKTIERWVASNQLKTAWVGKRRRTTLEWINEQVKVNSGAKIEAEQNGKLAAKPKGVIRDTHSEEERVRRSLERLQSMFGIGRKKMLDTNL